MNFLFRLAHWVLEITFFIIYALIVFMAFTLILHTLKGLCT